MNIDRLDPGERQDNDDCQQRQRGGHRVHRRRDAQPSDSTSSGRADVSR
jgi:hypothetical protein